MIMRPELWFVYDGACPVCTLGAWFYRVRREVGVLHGVDVRADPDHAIIQEIRQVGLNLDEGMIIKFQDKLYHGQEALILMAQLGADTGVLNKLNNRLFRRRWATKACYPLMKLTRRLALFLNGRGNINQTMAGNHKPNVPVPGRQRSEQFHCAVPVLPSDPSN